MKCPVCGDPLVERVRACPRCETPHHDDCWEFSGGCSIYGCAASASAAAALPVPAAGARSGALAIPAAADRLQFDTRLMHDQHTRLPAAVMPFWVAGLAITMSAVPHIFGLMLAMIPFYVTTVGWRFRPDRNVAEQTLRVLGVPVYRRSIPFDDILRIEVRDDEATLRLALVRTDGSAQVLSHEMGRDHDTRLVLRGIARGVQAHTPLHVTSALALDTVTAHKRLEALRAACDTVLPRQRDVAVVAFSAGAVLAVLAKLYCNMRTVAVVTTIWAVSALLALLRDRRTEPFPAHFREGLLVPSELVRVERELRGFQVDRTGAAVAVAGHVAIVAAFVVASRLGWHDVGPTIAALCAMCGTVTSAWRWRRAASLQARLATAQLGKDERAPEEIERERRAVVARVREAISPDPRMRRLKSDISARKNVGASFAIAAGCAVLAAVGATFSGTLVGLFLFFFFGLSAMITTAVFVGVMVGVLFGRPLPELERELAALEAREGVAPQRPPE